MWSRHKGRGVVTRSAPFGRHVTERFLREGGREGGWIVQGWWRCYLSGLFLSTGNALPHLCNNGSKSDVVFLKADRWRDDNYQTLTPAEVRDGQHSGSDSSGVLQMSAAKEMKIKSFVCILITRQKSSLHGKVTHTDLQAVAIGRVRSFIMTGKPQ